jgi:hypothetical protein
VMAQEQKELARKRGAETGNKQPKRGNREQV